MRSVEAYRAAFDALPPLTRLIFALHRFDDLSYAEIGEQLAIDIDTVMDFVAEALAMMVTILDGAPPSRLGLPQAAARIAAAEARIPPPLICDAWHRRGATATMPHQQRGRASGSTPAAQPQPAGRTAGWRRSIGRALQRLRPCQRFRH
jgi:hypothetical protein